MKRLFRKLKQLIGFRYYVSCRTQYGYMSCGPFTLRQAKKQCKDLQSWKYSEIEIVHCSRVIY